MVRVYVSIGSNVDREHNVRSCLRELRTLFGPLRVSTVYESRAVGFEGADFLNLVVGFDTTLGIREIAGHLRRIETAHGRRRDRPRFSSRTLDVDLLLYGDQIFQEDGLIVPRDEITRYDFVLRPLAELAGDERHPSMGVTFADLWAKFPPQPDPLRVVELPLADDRPNPN